MIRIYTLVCPQTNRIRYIGKTNRALKVRLNGHIQEAKRSSTSHKKRWIRQLLEIGLKPSIELLEEVPEGQKWQDRERHWIAVAYENGWPLTNQTAGGEGLDLIDPVAREAVKEKHAKSMKIFRDNNPGYMQSAIEGTRVAWATDREGRIAAIKAAWTPEVQAKHALAMEQIRGTPEFKDAQSAGQKRNWERNREKFLTAFANPETKARQKASKQRAWNDPEKRARLMNRWTPERKAAQAERIKSRGPEYKAMMAEKMRLIWAKRSPENRAKMLETTRAGKQA